MALATAAPVARAFTCQPRLPQRVAKAQRQRLVVRATADQSAAQVRRAAGGRSSQRGRF